MLTRSEMVEAFWMSCLIDGQGDVDEFDRLIHEDIAAMIEEGKVIYDPETGLLGLVGAKYMAEPPPPR
jgi:hypothetical protein